MHYAAFPLYHGFIILYGIIIYLFSQFSLPLPLNAVNNDPLFHRLCIDKDKYFSKSSFHDLNIHKKYSFVSQNFKFS